MIAVIKQDIKKVKSIPGEPVLTIRNLYKSFGNNKILKGINLTANKGESLVILGRSGSGKSVTIKCLVGLVGADKGKIKIFGTEITSLNNNEINDIRIRIAGCSNIEIENGSLVLHTSLGALEEYIPESYFLILS